MSFLMESNSHMSNLVFLFLLWLDMCIYSVYACFFLSLFIYIYIYICVCVCVYF